MKESCKEWINTIRLSISNIIKVQTKGFKIHTGKLILILTLL